MKLSPNGSIKVAYVLLHFPYHTETFVAEEIRAIQKQGVKVKILSLLGPGRGPIQPVSEQLADSVIYSPGILSSKLWISQLVHLLKTPKLYFQTLFTLLRCPHSQWFLASLAKRLVIFLKSVASVDQLLPLHIDMLHTHFAWLSGAGVWAVAQFLGLPYTVTVHAFDIFSSTDYVRLVCGDAAGTIAISEYNRQHLTGLGIQAAGSISVIHCGVDLDRFRFRSPSEKEHSSDRKIRVLSVGSLVQKKGHESLINACKLLLEQGHSLECTIIGDGPLRKDLSRLITSEGLQDHVYLIGPRALSEIAEAYLNHDLFVLASVVDATGDRDGIPVVLMEASASGLPVISTDISGIPEIVVHEKTGYLVAPGDVSAIAESILGLHSDISRRARIARNARQLTELEFDIQKNSKRVAAFFGGVVNASPGQVKNEFD